MLRAGSVEIPLPDNDILLAAERALFSDEHTTMEKIAELHELDVETYNESHGWEKPKFIEQQIVDCHYHLICVRRSLGWVRHVRAALLQEEATGGQ